MAKNKRNKSKSYTQTQLFWTVIGFTIGPMFVFTVGSIVVILVSMLLIKAQKGIWSWPVIEHPFLAALLVILIVPEYFLLLHAYREVAKNK